MELEAMDKIENVPRGEFAELILKGLIDEGYSGYEILDGHLFHADSVRQYGTAEVLSQRI